MTGGYTIAGGALVNGGATVTLDQDTLTQNFGAGGGGAIFNEAGTVNLNGDTISHNSTNVFEFCFGGCPLNGVEGGPGGGVYNTATLNITNSTIAQNTTGNGSGGGAGPNSSSGAGGGGGSGGSGGSGGGIFNASGATVKIGGSTISLNTTGNGGTGGNGGSSSAASSAGGTGGGGGPGGAGGGVENQGTMTISDSTITDNKTGVGTIGGTGGNATGSPQGAGGVGGAGGAGGSGGGIDSSTPISITNSTITLNTTAAGVAGGGGGSGSSGTAASGATGAPGIGGGVSQTAATATLMQDTVAGNTSSATGGGLDASGTSTVISETNSIVAGNSGSSDLNCAVGAGDQISDGGHNIVFGDTAATLCPGQNLNPKLAGALASNGGPTQTLALLAGSPAIGLVPLNACAVTSDQRGVARPQSSGCDAGAYEWAPPSISSVGAAAASTTTATVSASINPNLTSQNTAVVVNYGTSTAYGSSTTAQSIGNGSTPVAFTVGLSGLSAGTTYHYDVVATNGDGELDDGRPDLYDAGPEPPTAPAAPAATATSLPLAASLLSTSTKGALLAFSASCSGGSAGGVCAGALTLTAHVTTEKGKVVEVSAIAGQKKPKGPKKVTKDKLVGNGKYSISAGKSSKLSLSLNSTGKKLLDQFYKLKATLKTSGTLTLTRTVTFSYARIKSGVNFTWAFSPKSTKAELLTVTAVPSDGKVFALCHGGGCPFAKRSFIAKHRTATLTPALLDSHLTPGTVLTVEIEAANSVGKVVEFKILSGKQPSIASLCLPPGLSTPARCA